MRGRSSALFSRRLESLVVVGEGVLCGAVSSHARRLGALARPNDGLFLRVPLRGHPHLPAERRKCVGSEMRSPALIRSCVVATKDEILHGKSEGSCAGGSRSPTRPFGGGTARPQASLRGAARNRAPGRRSRIPPTY